MKVVDKIKAKLGQDALDVYLWMAEEGGHWSDTYISPLKGDKNRDRLIESARKLDRAGYICCPDIFAGHIRGWLEVNSKEFVEFIKTMTVES